MTLTWWLTLAAAAWAISLSPGPGAVTAMSAGLAHGFARGYAVTWGLVLGIWTQVLVVAAGVGALLAASTSAFALVKWAGVAYLVWLGVQQWRSRAAPVTVPLDAAPATSRWALVRRGWLVNVVNPKGTLFMLAVVPQFLIPNQPLAPQYAVIAATLGATDLVVMAGYTLAAARLMHWFSAPAHVRTLNRVFGALFVGAAAVLAGVRRGT